jgi:NarL family two-component system sensor histidine kinase LiaS
MSSFAHEFGQNHDIDVEMNVTGRGTAVDAGMQAEVLRVLHEAFSNAVRHGEAKSIHARILAEPEVLQIDVEDNGKGFTPVHGNGGGVGLDSMRERIGRRGGSLELVSAPGRRTRLHAHLPLRVSGGSNG